MSFSSVFYHISNFITQSILVIWFFYKVKPAIAVTPLRRFISILFFLLLLPLYISILNTSTISYSYFATSLRFFYRALVYALYLKYLKRFSWGTTIHLAVLCTVTSTVCQALLQTPLLFYGFDGIWQSFTSNTINILVFAISRYLLPLNRFYNITVERHVTLTLVIICLLYTKDSLVRFNYTGKFQTASLSVYLMFLQFFLLAFLIFFERYVDSSRQLEHNRLQEVVNKYQISNLQNRVAIETDLRAVHHDIKNHLLVINKLARQANAEQVAEYTHSLVESFSSYEKLIQTGNDLLDGLLGDKVREAENEQISVIINLDFRSAFFINSMDVCTIFGNAMDNAIEACRKLKQPEKKFIQINSNQAANYLLVTISNSYDGNVRLYNGLPITSKEKSALHGFGLPNIRRVMKNYGGSITIDIEENHYFVLTLFLPLS